MIVSMFVCIDELLDEFERVYPKFGGSKSTAVPKHLFIVDED